MNAPPGHCEILAACNMGFRHEGLCREMAPEKAMITPDDNEPARCPYCFGLHNHAVGFDCRSSAAMTHEEVLEKGKFGGALVILMKERDAALADNARLRGLIESVEDGGDDDPGCLWCAGFPKKHCSDCPAFEEDGKVK